MAKRDSQILRNLQKSKENFSFLRGDLFIKYPAVKADMATEAFKRGRETMKNRLAVAGNISHAKALEDMLNGASQAANFQTKLEEMTAKIIAKMLQKGEEGVNIGVDDINIYDYVGTLRGGTSFTRKTTAFSQAYSVYQDGLKKGKQYTEIAGAIGGGSYTDRKAGSAYDFLYQLNEGLLTDAQIQNLTKGFYDVSNLNGEILERVVQAVGDACLREGANFAANQTQAILDSIGSMDVTSKTIGQTERHVTLDLGERTGAIIYDSQGKTDVIIEIPDAEGIIEQMNISAKSVGRLSSEIHLLTGGNFMGLMAGAGLSDRKSYSSLTVYTHGKNYQAEDKNDVFKEMLLYQALAGTTALKDDFANYMVFQVGDSSKIKNNLHFRVIPMSSMLSSDNIQLTEYAKFKFSPNPLPIGANTYIQNYKGEKITPPTEEVKNPYPRTEETFNRLFNAKVSILLQSGFLKQIFDTVIK